MLLEIKRYLNKKYSIESKSVPLRIWTNDWPVPSKIILEKYSFNTMTSHKTKVNLSRQALWGEVESLIDFKNRVYKNKKPSKWGKGTEKSGRRFDYKIINNKIWIKILSKSPIINIENRKLAFDGKYLRISLKKNEVAAWYISSEGQIRFIILPDKINLDTGFFELIGILDGEMCKKVNKSGGSSLKISNAEPLIMKQLISNFKKYFDLPKDSWTASLTLNDKEPKNHDEKNLKKYWSKITGIRLERFTKTTIQKKYLSRFSDNGILQARFSNSLFFFILLSIMKNIRKILLLNKDYCDGYLRGLAAAEGSVIKRRNKLRMVQICGTDKIEKEFYKKCLLKIGITGIREYNNRVEMYGLSNFFILKKMNLFKIHPLRRKKFLESLDVLEKRYGKRTIQS